MIKLYRYTLLPYKAEIVIKIDCRKTDDVKPGNIERMKQVKRVECYSGYTLNERPKTVYWDDKRLRVVEMRDRWFGPDHTWFKVLADDGNLYLLRYDRMEDSWAIESLNKRQKENDFIGEMEFC